MKSRIVIVASSMGLASSPGLAQNPAFSAERMAEAEITSERIGDGLYVLFGVGGNIVASIGEQGVLIVDDQFPEMVPKYRAAIRELGGGEVDFAVNTHWHYDHADGNKQLGPDGTWLISQANSRRMMMVDNVVDTVTRAPFTQAAYAADALPFATFDRRMQLHFNGERIDLLHFGAAHTTGDAAVIFRSRNTVHLGDVFNGAGYPFIDSDNGGDLDGMIEFCEGVLAELEPGATVIPGHGAVAEYADLEAYISMLTGVRDNIAALIDEGATLEQVIAANPTAEWDERYGNSAGIVNRAFMTLSR